ncbi:MAG: radical SAM family heme chaperone HemW, partial [Clostridia bacterium]|nr:radical SAM family heme chaperone HemW [Clostridia bacterium]
MKKTKKPLGLYIHIPFCLKKCAYCDFYSCTGCDPDLVHHYISSCMLQMEDISESCRGYEIDTVYVGGGTPTTLPIKEFERLLSAVERNFKLSKYAEITTEANPATADKKYLKALRKLGVNRLSIGFQSANISELKLLGRIHTVEDFANMYKDARAAGFDNISVDLMYGIPAQSMQSFQSTLEYVCDMNPEHLSLYCLKIEEGTPFCEMRDSLELPGEDAEYDMYMWAVDYLRGRGYDRYEISNFA